VKKGQLIVAVNGIDTFEVALGMRITYCGTIIRVITSTNTFPNCATIGTCRTLGDYPASELLLLTEQSFFFFFFFFDMKIIVLRITYFTQ
jgi:hypothetical protein